MSQELSCRLTSSIACGCALARRVPRTRRVSSGRQLHVIVRQSKTSLNNSTSDTSLFLTCSAPIRSAYATICPSSSNIPASASSHSSLRKRQAPQNQTGTPPLVFVFAPHEAATLLTNLHHPDPLMSPPRPYAMPRTPRCNRFERIRSKLSLEERPHTFICRTGCASAAGWTGATLAPRPGRCQDARSTRQGRDRPARQLHALVRAPLFEILCVSSSALRPAS